MKQFLMPLWEVFEILAVAVISILLIYHFIAQPFQVSGASMEPNFVNDEYVVVDEITYNFNNPSRGQVIVFRDPLDEKDYFIKRVIGLPGDVVSIHDGKVYVNGSVQSEPYLPAGLAMSGDVTYPKLGPNQYFVMGDNRSESFDSRSWGPVTRSEIVGVVRAGVDFWPPSVAIYD
ncbi:MAG: signal peptidase I [Patescibacteria group bacterium]|nr:signal peptidase I [Patescibacteria group bacterium]MCL5224355.1 signal peptidase I [Patescibacteria group bacterium]